jgi:cell division protein FtsX
MKFLASVFLMALVGFALGLYLPWWSVALAGFVISFFLYQKPLIALLTGFISIFLLWGLLTIVRSQANDHILAHRVSILILQKDSPNLLILVSALIGGITGGMGAICGSLLRRIRIAS